MSIDFTSLFDNPVTTTLTTILGGAIRDKFGNDQDDRINAATLDYNRKKTSQYRHEASADVRNIVTKQSFITPKTTRPEQRRSVAYDAFKKRMQQVSYDHPYFIGYLNIGKATSAPRKKVLDSDVMTPTQFSALADTNVKKIQYK